VSNLAQNDQIVERMTSKPEVDFPIADDKPASRRKGISAVVGPNALTSVGSVQSIPIPIRHTCSSPSEWFVFAADRNTQLI
jgi:hypothetical protein